MLTGKQEMDVVDVDAICAALRVAKRTLAAEFKAQLLGTYTSLATDEPFAVDKKQVGGPTL